MNRKGQIGVGALAALVLVFGWNWRNNWSGGHVTAGDERAQEKEKQRIGRELIERNIQSLEINLNRLQESVEKSRLELEEHLLNGFGMESKSTLMKQLAKLDADRLAIELRRQEIFLVQKTIEQVQRSNEHPRAALLFILRRPGTESLLALLNKTDESGWKDVVVAYARSLKYEQITLDDQEKFLHELRKLALNRLGGRLSIDRTTQKFHEKVDNAKQLLRTVMHRLDEMKEAKRQLQLNQDK